MVLGPFDMLARAGFGRKRPVEDPDQHFAFIRQHQLPELLTIVAAPDELRSQRLKAYYDHRHRSLTVVFPEGDDVRFVFREEDIMVLTKEPFVIARFRERLQASLSQKG